MGILQSALVTSYEDVTEYNYTCICLRCWPPSNIYCGGDSSILKDPNTGKEMEDLEYEV
jgi:hypothetical protein